MLVACLFTSIKYPCTDAICKQAMLHDASYRPTFTAVCLTCIQSRQLHHFARPALWMAWGPGDAHHDLRAVRHAIQCEQTIDRWPPIHTCVDTCLQRSSMAYHAVMAQPHITAGKACGRCDPHARPGGGCDPCMPYRQRSWGWTCSLASQLRRCRTP